MRPERNTQTFSDRRQYVLRPVRETLAPRPRLPRPKHAGTEWRGSVAGTGPVASSARNVQLLNNNTAYGISQEGAIKNFAFYKQQAFFSAYIVILSVINIINAFIILAL